MGCGLLFRHKVTGNVYLSLGFKNYTTLGIRLQEHTFGETTLFSVGQAAEVISA